MSKGKKPIQVDKVELSQLLNDLEIKNVYKNRSELWKAVEDSDFAKQCVPRPLTAQVAMMLANKFGIEPRTPKGKKGRSPGEGMPPGTVPGNQKKELSEEVLKALQDIIPNEKKQAYSSLMEKVKKRSLKSLIRLKCLDCSNHQRNEVKYCPVDNCPLHCVRPYQ